jgi:hypothetical protein
MWYCYLPVDSKKPMGNGISDRRREKNERRFKKTTRQKE